MSASAPTADIAAENIRYRGKAGLRGLNPTSPAPSEARQAGSVGGSAAVKGSAVRWVVPYPKGPSRRCNDGYKGRVGIFQVMEVSEVMGRIIMEGGNSMQIADQAAKEGVIDLRQAGLNKVKEGVTSLEEINRVTIE